MCGCGWGGGESVSEDARPVCPLLVCLGQILAWGRGGGGCGCVWYGCSKRNATAATQALGAVCAVVAAVNLSFLYCLVFLLR